MSSYAVPTVEPAAARQHADQTLAAAITKSASLQTYYTIRFLVDRERVADAYRAYAYFRWVDDHLDAETGTRPERVAFVNRQNSLLERCYRGETPRHLTDEETMLVTLVQGDHEQNSGLQAYIHNMMAVMSFDAERRGRLITQDELTRYTHHLAVAVTEAMHYFIGHCCKSPKTETRYLAVKGAHIVHMLRDTFDDVAAGYFNIPREYIEAHGIQPGDVENAAYRDWVRQRVRLARSCFQAGRNYLAQVENLRCRLAGYAYTGRFEGVLDAIEREGYLLRSEFPERKSLGSGLRMGLAALTSLVNPRLPGMTRQTIATKQYPLKEL